MNDVVILRNAILNVLRIGASAFIGLLLPPILIRIISPDVYSVWVIILQISGYVALFDFGIQVAVGRFIASANALGDYNQQSKVVSTSLAMLWCAALLSVVFIVALAWQLPHLFQRVHPILQQDAQFALLYIGCSLAIGLPFSVFNGVFIGQQRNHVPVSITISSKIVSAIFVVVAANATMSLVVMSIVIASINFATYAIQYAAYRQLIKNIIIAKNFISLEMARVLFAYCFGLSMWSFAVLLIAGIDTVLVGIFDFNAVTYYAVAVSIVTFIASMQSAAFSALLPAGAILHVKGNKEELGTLLISTTRYSFWIVLMISIPFIFFAKNIFTLWLGVSYPEYLLSIFRVLLIANILRMSWTPYFTLLAATGQQRLVIITPFIEGLVNLLFSLIGGFYMGAIGIAMGTVIGAIVGFVCYTFYNMPRTDAIKINTGNYIFDAVGRPIFCVTPAYLSFLLPIVLPGLHIWVTALLMLSIITMTLLISWYYVLTQAERQKLALLVTSVLNLFSKRITYGVSCF